MRRLLLLATAAAISSCGPSNLPATDPAAQAEIDRMSRPAEPAPFALAEEARAGVDDAAFGDLLVRHWDWTMQQSPVWASTRGDHRFDSRLSDRSAAAIAEARKQVRAFRDEAAKLQAQELSARDATTLALFIEDLDASIASEVCEFHLWSVSARGNVLTSINRLPEDHKLTDSQSARALWERYQAIPRAIDDATANIKAGIGRGLMANAQSLQLTVAMIEAEIAKPTAEWALVALLEKALAESSLEAADKEPLAGARALVEGEIKTALERYLSALRDEALPMARKGDQIGLGGLPIGEACYSARIKSYLAIDKSPAEIHEFGMQEIQRINGEMVTLGRKLFATKKNQKPKLAAVIERLRTDPDLYYQDGPAIVAKAEESLARAKAAIPEYFGILPKADCRVVEIPDYEAPFTTIAYYRGPDANGKPGEYFINTFEPKTRPRFEMEVLAYHESIPGHHLQIAIAQELGDLPAFRRYGGSTAFVEGWALYTERLSNEMGLYSGDIDRMGMLSYDAWRASRLVVDTGVHAMGWTREQAENFMLEHTALTPGNIKNEVDRYISWPGQALAYKIGQQEILRLRSGAMDALGDAFDIRGFHDAVLGSGAVTLPVLASQVQAWVESKKSP